MRKILYPDSSTSLTYHRVRTKLSSSAEFSSLLKSLPQLIMWHPKDCRFVSSDIFQSDPDLSTEISSLWLLLGHLYVLQSMDIGIELVHKRMSNSVASHASYDRSAWANFPHLYLRIIKRHWLHFSHVFTLEVLSLVTLYNNISLWYLHSSFMTLSTSTTPSDSLDISSHNNIPVSFPFWLTTKSIIGGKGSGSGGSDGDLEKIRRKYARVDYIG